MKCDRTVAAVAALIVMISAIVVSSPASARPVRPEEGQVERLYRAVFDRSPDAAGFAYWFRLRSTTVPLEAIAAEFIASPEFAMVAGAPTSTEFIERLYRNVLDREPDVEGLQYWQRLMTDGLSRVQLLVLFSESAEFANTTETSLEVLPAFRSSIEPVDAVMLGASWRPGCPVAPSDLRRLSVSIVGLDGRPSEGELIVHRSVADEMVSVFDRLYQGRYPIERMESIADFDGDDDASMAANNTSGFNCRPIVGGTGWSRHAYGVAVDVNPLQNPYVRGSVVLPPSGAAFVDRTVHDPAMIRRGDVVVEAFAEAGWRWGGDFTTLADWQHFER